MAEFAVAAGLDPRGLRGCFAEAFAWGVSAFVFFTRALVAVLGLDAAAGSPTELSDAASSGWLFARGPRHFFGSGAGDVLLSATPSGLTVNDSSAICSS